jgi:hypothetical protein
MKNKIVFALDGSQPLAVVTGTDNWDMIVQLWSSQGKPGTPIAIVDAPEKVVLDVATLYALAQAWHLGLQGPKKGTRAPLIIHSHD